MGVVRDTLLNNQEVFNRVFGDETVFPALPEEEYFNRLNTVFGQAEAVKESLNKVAEIEQVVDSVTEKREIKQLINQQLEKTKLLKNKLDEVKDELFAD